MFSSPVEIKFENTKLLAPKKNIQYLECRYGDYMKLPPKEQRALDIHAEIYYTERGFEEYVSIGE